MFEFEYSDKGDEKVELTPGAASFTIVDAKAKDANDWPLMTKGGVPKLVLTMDVTDIQGNRGKMFEHIALNEASSWKLRDVLKAAGKAHLFTRECKMEEVELIGCSGNCMLTRNGEYLNMGSYSPAVGPVEIDTTNEVPF